MKQDKQAFSIHFQISLGDIRAISEPKSRISFSNLKDFISRLKDTSSNSRESLSNIRNNIQNLNVFGKTSTTEAPLIETTSGLFNLLPATLSRRPPYMFNSEGDDTTLPSSILANMVTNFAGKLTTTPSTTTTTTTTTPFSMPNFFGALLTSTPEPELMENITTEDLVESTTNYQPDEVPTTVHHHFHHFQEETSTAEKIDMNSW